MAHCSLQPVVIQRRNVQQRFGDRLAAGDLTLHPPHGDTSHPALLSWRKANQSHRSHSSHSSHSTRRNATTPNYTQLHPTTPNYTIINFKKYEPERRKALLQIPNIPKPRIHHRSSVKLLT